MTGMFATNQDVIVKTELGAESRSMFFLFVSETGLLDTSSLTLSF